jgi:hypothetical protein
MICAERSDHGCNPIALTGLSVQAVQPFQTQTGDNPLAIANNGLNGTGRRSMMIVGLV